MSKVPLLAVFAAFAVAPATAFACGDRNAAIAAVEARSFDVAATLYANVDSDPSCDDGFRAWLGERLAEDFFRAAMFDAADRGQREALLRTSLRYSQHWRTYVALADLAAARNERGAVATLLQDAINRLNEGPEHHSAAPEEIAALHRRASDALLLAGGEAEVPRTRSGALGGVFAERIRGFQVTEVDLPITFDVNSAKLNEQGEKFASTLLDHLTASGARKIVIEGHTDPDGADAYNLALSLRRAETVREYLTLNGFDGEIVIVGKGETEVPTPPDGVEVGSEAHYQLARRVVLVRS